MLQAESHITLHVFSISGEQLRRYLPSMSTDRQMSGVACATWEPVTVKYKMPYSLWNFCNHFIVTGAPDDQEGMRNRKRTANVIAV
jgi:hypothetical protein